MAPVVSLCRRRAAGPDFPCSSCTGPAGPLPLRPRPPCPAPSHSPPARPGPGQASAWAWAWASSGPSPPSAGRAARGAVRPRLALPSPRCSRPKSWPGAFPFRLPPARNPARFPRFQPRARSGPLLPPRCPQARGLEPISHGSLFPPAAEEARSERWQKKEAGVEVYPGLHPPRGGWHHGRRQLCECGPSLPPQGWPCCPAGPLRGCCWLCSQQYAGEQGPAAPAAPALCFCPSPRCSVKACSAGKHPPDKGNPDGAGGYEMFIVLKHFVVEVQAFSLPVKQYYHSSLLG